MQLHATRITLSSTHPGVLHGQGNIAWRMLERCLERLGLHAQVHIHIDKQLPLQGGLGAGSANAVAALIGLEQELEPPALAFPNRLRDGGGNRFRCTVVSCWGEQ